MKPIIILCSLTFLLSCNKYLDKPGDPTKKIPHTVADVQLLLDKPIPTGCIYLGTDEYFVPASRWKSARGVDRNFHLTWNPHTALIHMNPGLWSNPYLSVFNANLSIELLNEMGHTAQNKKDWDNAMGIAYFNRAWSLLTVAWQFSKAWHEENSKTDLGAVLDLSSDVHETLSRSTVAETYNQIIKDAEEAVKFLPIFPSHPTRPSKLAAYGLLARIYLSMRKYDLVLQQCNLYLSQFNTLINYNDPSLLDLGPYITFKPFNNEVIYHNVPTVTGTRLQPDYITVDTVLYNSYAEKDLRKKAFFKPYEGYYRFGGSYSGGTDPMTGICTDEMYITRAECFARRGEVDKAMKDLNDLLITRWETNQFVPLTAATKEEALAKVLVERKKELFFRGLRMMDIKRLNEEGANITITHKSPDLKESGTLPAKSPRFAMQLPDELVRAFGYQQNPID